MKSYLKSIICETDLVEAGQRAGAPPVLLSCHTPEMAPPAPPQQPRAPSTQTEKYEVHATCLVLYHSDMLWGPMLAVQVLHLCELCLRGRLRAVGQPF